MKKEVANIFGQSSNMLSSEHEKFFQFNMFYNETRQIYNKVSDLIQ